MIKVITVVLLATLSGCAVFDGGKVPETTLAAYQYTGVAKPTLSYSSSAFGGLSATKELPATGQSIIEGELLSVLESSDYFARIAKNDKTADISVQVTMTNKANSAAVIPAMITGFSLYTIPSWATDEFELIAKAKRSDGLEKDYVLADSTTIVQWLPMIFAFPFKNFSVIPDVRKNMYKKVLSNMQDDGFFSASANTVSLAK